MIDLNTAAVYWLSSEPMDMRKGREKFVVFVKDKMGFDPVNGRNSADGTAIGNVYPTA